MNLGHSPGLRRRRGIAARVANPADSSHADLSRPDSTASSLAAHRPDHRSCERATAPGAAGSASPAEAAPSTPAPNPTAPNFTWPASLQPFGEGYPNPGDPCRRLGESPAVADFLDHTQVLVGCPGRADDVPATTVIADGHGKPLAQIDGVTVIAVPPNAAM